MEKQLAAEADPSTGYGTDFFRKDTAHLRGFLKGYDPRAGFSTGMIYTGNEPVSYTHLDVYKRQVSKATLSYRPFRLIKMLTLARKL